jgi:hypothetical protein
VLEGSLKTSGKEIVIQRKVERKQIDVKSWKEIILKK